MWRRLGINWSKGLNPETRPLSTGYLRLKKETPVVPRFFFTGKYPVSSALEGGVKRHNIKGKYLTGKPRPLGRGFICSLTGKSAESSGLRRELHLDKVSPPS
jgi:hypothetical protein